MASDSPHSVVPVPASAKIFASGGAYVSGVIAFGLNSFAYTTVPGGTLVPGTTIYGLDVATISGDTQVTEPVKSDIASAKYNIKLSAPAVGDITVTYGTKDFSTVAGERYFPFSSSHTFHAGESSYSFEVPILGDGIPQPAQEFSVSITSISTNSYVQGVYTSGDPVYTSISDYMTIPENSSLRTPLVDAKYYYELNQDVKNTGINAEVHYNQYGWHEGRNPDAFFSTNGYLAANSDIAKAGINPLTHYDQFGWKEGRDPSAAFDNELYLAHNADVKAAGIDPLAHYLQSGQAEGRQIYAAIGKAADFTHGSFDAEYYLLANADVAKAALTSGGDTFAFAFQHYQNNGWKEGRAADAYFDSAYYLAHNPDVAAAGINPLTHYDQVGWKEGRDPSAAFHTNAYLAANPDVAAAHIDPLTHYLQYGADEGRHLA